MYNLDWYRTGRVGHIQGEPITISTCMHACRVWIARYIHMWTRYRTIEYSENTVARYSQFRVGYDRAMQVQSHGTSQVKSDGVKIDLWYSRV